MSAYLFLYDNVPRPTPRLTVAIAGITGQDGSYLAEALVGRGHEVHGIVRRDPDERHERLRLLRGDVTLHHADVRDRGAVEAILRQIRPDRILNLTGLQPFPPDVMSVEASVEANGLTALSLLEATRQAAPRSRFLQAVPSAVLAPSDEPLRVTSPIGPDTPYGLGKAVAVDAVRYYRESHGVWAVNAILFPHTSPRQSLRRLARRVTHAAANIRLGDPGGVRVRRLDATMDIGFAGDYAEAMWLALQRDCPQGECLIGSGTAVRVRDFVQESFDYVERDWFDHVREDREVDDPEPDGRICHGFGNVLGWEPRVSLRQLVQAMIVSEFYLLEAVRGDPRRHPESTSLSGVRGPRPIWPLGRPFMRRKPTGEPLEMSPGMPDACPGAKGRKRKA